MKRRFAVFAVMFGLLPLTIASALKAGATRFTFTTVDVPNALSTFLGGVANDGTVVGYYMDQSTTHGFSRTTDGIFHFPLDCPVNVCPNTVSTFLHRIDSQAQTAAGYWFDNMSVQHGLVVELATNTYISIDFPSLGVQGTLLNGINKHGDISGGYVDSAGNEHGFTSNLSCVTLPSCYQTIDFPEAPQTELGNVNDNDDIVGIYLSDKGHIVSFLLSGATFTTLSSPSRAVVFARGINNVQQIVGYDSGSIAFHSTHGFFLSSLTAQAMPVNFPGPDAAGTGVGSINDFGMIAGQYNSPGSVTHGFIAVPTN